MDAVQAKSGIVLMLGGARSGKSELAERVAGDWDSPFTYVATGAATAVGDGDWNERVARHRARRPREWATVELSRGGDLAAVVRELDGPVLVDSLGTWVAGVIAGVGEVGSPDEVISAAAVDADRLVAALEERRASGLATLLVSEEVGLGVHPSSAVGRRFRDVLGEVNQAVAEVADEVFLVVAGRVIALQHLGSPAPSRPVPGSPDPTARAGPEDAR